MRASLDLDRFGISSAPRKDAMALERIVSKKLTSRYESGACNRWLKVKNPTYERR
jgi:ATP-dependent DNA ligase